MAHLEVIARDADPYLSPRALPSFHVQTALSTQHGMYVLYVLYCTVPYFAFPLLSTFALLHPLTTLGYGRDVRIRYGSETTYHLPYRNTRVARFFFYRLPSSDLRECKEGGRYDFILAQKMARTEMEREMENGNGNGICLIVGGNGGGNGGNENGEQMRASHVTVLYWVFAFQCTVEVL